MRSIFLTEREVTGVNCEPNLNSRIGTGRAVVRLNETLAALRRDLSGTRSEVLRLSGENIELRQRLNHAAEEIDRLSKGRVKARQLEILAMVRQRQCASRLQKGH
jgi:hypothetical protein